MKKVSKFVSIGLIMELDFTTIAPWELTFYREKNKQGKEIGMGCVRKAAAVLNRVVRESRF